MVPRLAAAWPNAASCWETSTTIVRSLDSPVRPPSRMVTKRSSFSGPINQHALLSGPQCHTQDSRKSAWTQIRSMIGRFLRKPALYRSRRTVPVLNCEATQVPNSWPALSNKVTTWDRRSGTEPQCTSSYEPDRQKGRCLWAKQSTRL